MGLSIPNRHYVYPTFISISICHGDWFSMEFNKRTVVTERNREFIHSDILDQAQNDQLYIIGNDLKVINVGINEEHIPTTFHYETYLDAMPPNGTVLNFELHDGTILSLSNNVLSYEPATGWLQVYSDYRCRNKYARYDLEAKLSQSGWVT